MNALGHIDIVMVAVDGERTLSQEDAAAVVEQLQPRIVLPMHYFTRGVLAPSWTWSAANMPSTCATARSWTCRGQPCPCADGDRAAGAIDPGSAPASAAVVYR